MDTVQYFKHIATKNQKLPKHEQIRLARLAKNQDVCEQARNKAKQDLLNSTYGYCLKFAKHKRTDHMIDYAELLHICIEAQEKAFQNFDPDMNVAFSTYLKTWLCSLIVSNIKQMRVVALPSSVSLRDSVIRVSMTGMERDYDYCEEDREDIFAFSLGQDVGKVRVAMSKQKLQTGEQLALAI